jgi:hypothetical protein
MKNFDQKMAELKAENEKELNRKIKELHIKEQLLQATGLDFMMCVHSEKSISIWIENDQYNNYSKFDRMKIKQYYEGLCTIFTPTNANVKVSGGEYKNEAPVKFEFINHFSEITFNHQQRVKISFAFNDGIKVDFVLPSPPHYKTFDENLISYKYAELKPGRKNPMAKHCFYMVGFERVNMYGNDFYIYCKQPEQVETFLNVAFFGKKAGENNQ